MESFDPAAATAAYLASLSPEDTARAEAYTRGGYLIMLGDFLVAVGAAWLILKSGVLVWVRDGLQSKRKRPWLASLAAAVTFLVATWAITLPWSIYAQWFRVREFGLTQQPLGGWLVESMISAGIMALVLGLLIMGLYALIRKAPRTWWMWATGLISATFIFALLVSPILIEPIFNTYTPAPDGEVRDAVVELAERTGTPSDKIFIYDGSRQSDRYTANVSGIFGTARVAMSDVMFAQGADLQEVRAVVAHEMAHYTHMHYVWLVAIMTGLAAVGLLLVRATFLVTKRLMGAGRVGGIDDPAGLPVIAAIFATLSLLSTPVVSSLSRLVEEDADRYSLAHAQEPDGLARALIKTAEYRAPSPTLIEEIIFYDHPSVERRIRRAMEWKAAHQE